MPVGLFEFGWIDVLDVAVVSVLLYTAIVWLRRARAGLVLAGIGILGGFYVAARQLGLQLTAWIFQGFFAIFVIILVVIFQQELRQIFERIAVWGLRRGRREPTSSQGVEALVRSAIELARNRVGALIVVRGEDPLERHVEGGVPLDGRVSDALLNSLFEPHTVAHDGAVIVEGDRVTRFAGHLPLSHDFDQLRRRGTRHGAALGLAERTDALCIVVSEERGSISVAREGELRELEDPTQLETVLAGFLREKTHAPARRALLLRTVRENGFEKALAVVLALGLWVVFVPGAQTAELTLTVPVALENLPPGYVVDKIEPSEVALVLQGRRRELFFLDPKRVEVRVEALLVAMGRRTFELTSDSVKRPPGLEVVAFDPPRVRLSVRRQNEAAPAQSGARGDAAESRGRS